MRTLQIIILIASICGACQINYREYVGSWVNSDDNKWKVQIRKDSIYNYYDDELLNKNVMKVTSTSCNPDYAGIDVKSEFIELADQECYEVVGINKNSLFLRSTISGKQMQFFRLNDDGNGTF